MSIEMSLAENKTFQIFRTFMPRRKEILNYKNHDVFDLIIYPKGYFLKFNPTTNFKKHALAKVSNFNNTPEGMEQFTLTSGKYAEFTIKGHIPNPEIFNYIYSTWLPNSDFSLNDRPHFDILSEKMQQKSTDADQELWIPVPLK